MNSKYTHAHHKEAHDFLQHIPFQTTIHFGLAASIGYLDGSLTILYTTYSDRCVHVISGLPCSPWGSSIATVWENRENNNSMKNRTPKIRIWLTNTYNFSKLRHIYICYPINIPLSHAGLSPTFFPFKFVDCLPQSVYQYDNLS